MSLKTISNENDKYLESISETGVLTLGSRFKRITDMLFSQVQDLYNERGIKFKSTWFAFLLTLKHSKSLDIKSLAQRRKISHSAASQIVKEMTKQGLVTSEVESSDQRQKKITITEKGSKILDQLIPLLKIIENSLLDVLGEQFENFFHTLDTIEYDLSQTPFKARRLPRLENIEIVNYTNSHKADFEKLTKNWLEKYFTLEPRDEELFEDPKAHTNGGEIFMALVDGQARGTLSLIPHSERTIELAKMGVDDVYQGRGLGGALVEKAIEFSKAQGYKEMIIETDTVLKVSIELYKKYGFRDDPRKDHSYANRGNIWLKRTLI